jgi:antitoxin component of MazEF toxin-antitoxin module
MDDKKHHAQEEAQEEKSSTAEVIDFGEGSLAIIIPEEVVRRLGWREGEEVEVGWQEGKISVTRSESPAE